LGLGLLLPPTAAGRLVVVQKCVVIFAFWYILGCVALLAELVVDETELTALLSGGDTVETDEELGAVVGVSVLGMGVELSEFVNGSSLGTLEPTSCFIRVGGTVFSVGGLRPVTDSGIFVEPETGRTGVLLGDTINASVEDVADSGVGVRIESVQTGTQVAGALGGLEFKSVSAVDVEVVVAGFPLSGEGIEDETVLT